MFKLAITAFLVISCYYNSFASAKSISTSAQLKASPLVSKKNLAAVEKSIKDVPNADRWTTDRLLTYFTDLSVGNVSKEDRLVILGLLRMDLVTMSDSIKPAHLILPLQTNTREENEHRVIIKAAHEMLLNLRYMEKTNEILIRVCDNVYNKAVMENQNSGIEEVKAAAEYILNSVSKSLFKFIDDAMKNDSELSEKYQINKKEAQSQIISEPKITGPILVSFRGSIMSDEEIFKDLTERPLMRRMGVNKMFMTEASEKTGLHFHGNNVNGYALTRCIIEWSKNETETDEANNLYKEVLSNVGSRIKFKINWGYDDDEKLKNHLNQELNSKIKSKPSVLALLNPCQEKIIRSNPSGNM